MYVYSKIAFEVFLLLWCFVLSLEQQLLLLPQILGLSKQCQAQLLSRGADLCQTRYWLVTRTNFVPPSQDSIVIKCFAAELMTDSPISTFHFHPWGYRCTAHTQPSMWVWDPSCVTSTPHCSTPQAPLMVSFLSLFARGPLCSHISRFRVEQKSTQPALSRVLLYNVCGPIATFSPVLTVA